MARMLCRFVFLWACGCSTTTKIVVEPNYAHMEQPRIRLEIELKRIAQ